MIAADLIVRRAATALNGPLVFLERCVEAGLGEAVEVIDATGHPRLGRIAGIDQQRMVVEILDPASRLSLNNVQVRFLGTPLRLGVGPGMLGRIYNGVGLPIDGGPPVPLTDQWLIDGLPINPMARELPRDFIETGVSTIDLLNSLVRGQKLPIFSAGGLPHDRLVLDIVRHARLPGHDRDQFAIVVVGIGIAHGVAEQFRRTLEDSGALEHTALFLNLASDPSTQRLLTPRYALTAAEYLAFHEHRHVLVILTDMTNYCEALREVSASHGEMPGRKGYPGYMYSDLASIFERAGAIQGIAGTLTQLPILTMPGDDISHPIPDLTGYITEGQIVLGRVLDRAGVYPPVDVLPSLSRLMDEGTGEGYTHADHPALASQLYAAYARAVQARTLARVVGEAGLSATDRRYLQFGRDFEARFVAQGKPRTLEASMDIGWALLRQLPAEELSRLSDAQIAAHLGTAEAAGG